MRICYERALGIAVGAVLLASPGQLLAAKYDKREVEIKATESRHTKVEKPDPQAKKEQRRPKFSGEAFRARAKAQVSKLTDDAIAKMRQLINITSDDDGDKPDYYFRLAEHYRDKKVQYNFAARELDEKIFLERDKEQQRRFKSRQQQYEKAEKQWMLGAIKLYLSIATKPAFGRYKRMDEVLFNVADMLAQDKRHKQARIFFSKLIRNFPQSKYIPDAYLSFAEYYFNNNEIVKALNLYQRVGRYPKSSIYGYAVYKQGWCWLNLKDPRKALEKFVQVIRHANNWSGSKKGKIILVKEAKKDAVRAYSQLGEPDRAWNFFKRIGGSYAMTMLERLANIYYDQGKFDFSSQVFRKLIELNPKSPKLCNWQYNIMRAALSGQDKKGQVDESRRLAAIYHLLRKSPKAKKSQVAECRENASGVLRELATTWHREAQKTQNVATYALAEQLYKEYLTNFPDVPDAYTMSFYYAELLFKLKRWEPAAAAYSKVVKLQKNGKYLKEAAYAAVISWKNALDVNDEAQDSGRRGVKPEDKHKPRPIPPKEKKMMEAFDTYLSYVPDSPERIKIMYRKARIYYDNNHFDKAADGFSRLALQYPKDRLAEIAANLLLDSLNILKRYEELERWVHKLLGMPDLARGELLATLNQLKRDIARKKLEQYREKGRYRECGDGYAQLANDYPDDKRWAEIAYNAAMCYEAAKLLGQAIKIRNQLIQVKLNDKADKAGQHLAQRSLYLVGGNFHGLAWYSHAADYYEKFAKQFPGEKEAPEALQNAIIFRLGRAEWDKAKDNVAFFAKTYGGRPKFRSRAAAAFFSLKVIYDHAEDRDALMKFYQAYLRKWGAYGGKDRQILANVAIGRALWAASCPHTGLNGACVKQQRVRSKRKIRKKTKRRKKSIELRAQCGPETKSKITVFKRNPAKLRKAMGHFKTALRLSRRATVKGGTKSELAHRTQAMRMALAEAKFHEAEALFESFLEVKFPSGLDFSGGSKAKDKVKKKSIKKFMKFLDQKGKLLARARKSYQEVIKMKVAHWAIAGAARVGQLFQQFADGLYTAPVPKPPIPKQLRTRDQKEEFVMTFTDAYCDQLEDKARPLEDKAVQGLAFCLNKSTEVSWYNEWSQLCESELNQIKPAQYPLASEIRARPGYLRLRAAMTRAITELN